MKIVHVLGNLGCGGAEKAVVELCNYLAGKHEIYLLCLDKAGDPAKVFFVRDLDDRINLFFFNKRAGVDYKVFFRLYRRLKKIGPHVLNFHLGCLIYGAPFLLLDRKIKIIYTIHSLHALNNTFRRKLFYSILFKLKTVCFIANSRAVMNYNQHVFGMKRISFIYFGMKQMQPARDSGKILKEITGYKKSNRTRMLISVARLHREKNHSLLLKGFKRLIEAGYDVILLIIGEATDHPYFYELKEKACKGVFFLGKKENIAGYLALSDIFCLTSAHEGLSLATIEALSMKVLPVCTPAGGVTEIVKDDYNGFLSIDHSADQYFKTLKYALDMEESKKERMRQNAFQSYLDNFTIDKCGRAYLKLYQQPVFNRSRNHRLSIPKLN